jgi:hypothetical protein
VKRIGGKPAKHGYHYNGKGRSIQLEAPHGPRDFNMLLSVALLTTLVTIGPSFSPSFGEPVRGPGRRSLNSAGQFLSQTTNPSTDSFIPFPSVQFSLPLVPTSIGTIRPSIGSPTNFLGTFTPAIGTPATALGTFQAGIGSPIASLGSFSPGIGRPVAALGSFQPSIGTPASVLGSFQPSIGGLQRNAVEGFPVLSNPVIGTPVVPVTLSSTGPDVSTTAVDGFFFPSSAAGLNVAITNERLIVLNPTDSSTSNILNPEPSSLVLFTTALGGLALLRKWSLRKTHRHQAGITIASHRNG